MKKSLHHNLGTYLKEKRTAAGVTQLEAAKKLNLSSAQFVSNFERGLCSPPLKHIKTLIKLYDIPPEEIFVLMMTEQEQILRRALNLSPKVSPCAMVAGK